MAGYIDTHTHIYLEEFDADRAEVVSRARAAGAEALFLPNIDATSVAPMLRLCEAYPGFCLPMLGLHPTELPPDPRPVLDEMERMLAADRRFIAVGEVGLDFYWDDSRRDEQIEVFRRQVEWAVRFRLPLMIHCRSAHRELVDVLRPYAEKLAGGVFHCFGGTADEARELLAFRSRSHRFPRCLPRFPSAVSCSRPTLPTWRRRLIEAGATNQPLSLWS